MNESPHHATQQSDALDPRKLCSLSGTPLFWDLKPKNVLRHIAGRADVVCAVACGFIIAATALCDPAKAQKIVEWLAPSCLTIGFIAAIWLLLEKIDLPNDVPKNTAVYKGNINPTEARNEKLLPTKIRLGDEHKTYWRINNIYVLVLGGVLSAAMAASAFINPAPMSFVAAGLAFIARRLQKGECQMKLSAGEWTAVVMPSRQQSNAQQDVPKLTK